MNTNENANIEIDVLHLLKKIWSKKFFIIFVTLFFGVLSLLGSIFLIKPQYTSTTRIYVVNQTSDNITNQDLQAGSYLVNDYKEIIKSADVLAKVIEDENLPDLVEELSKKVSVSIPTDTRVISISVEDYDAKKASDIANAVRQIASDKIKAVTKVDDVTTLEEAEEATTPSSPNIKRNAALGGIVGAFLAVILILLAEVLDDRIRRPEDVEEILGMALLGVVPNTDKI